MLIIYKKVNYHNVLIDFLHKKRDNVNRNVVNKITFTGAITP